MTLSASYWSTPHDFKKNPPAGKPEREVTKKGGKPINYQMGFIKWENLDGRELDETDERSASSFILRIATVFFCLIQR